MIQELSFPRIAKIASVVGLLGAIAAGLRWGAGTALGFLIGSVFSYFTLRSWARIADSLGQGDAEKSGSRLGVSAAFLVLRYSLIGITIYVIVKVLGITPVAIAAGLLVSFAAVVAEVVYGSFFAK